MGGAPKPGALPEEALLGYWVWLHQAHVAQVRYRNDPRMTPAFAESLFGTVARHAILGTPPHPPVPLLTLLSAIPFAGKRSPSSPRQAITTGRGPATTTYA